MFALLTGLGLCAIFCWLVRLRYIRPQWPVSDPDTWGYLHPAISRLLGGAFEHTYGRNFLYPGWVYLLLRVTDDFRAIVVAQHILGLAASLLMWVIWRQWRDGFTATRLPAWADALFGLGLTAFFGGASSVIFFEEQIRPEAVFPFFAALDLSLLLAFVRAWYVEDRTRRAALLGGLSLFATALVYQLKPSFGLAAGFAALPVGLALFVPGRQEAWRPRLHLLGAMAAGILATAVLLVLPERSLARNDQFSILFLPETLLTIHAGIIRDQMNEDVREGAETPFPIRWLAPASRYFDGEVRRASDPAQLPYPTLGYNPDYLLYQDSFCRWLYGQLPATQIAGFCYYYYGRAWRRHPAAMLTKVGRELGEFYSFHCPAFVSSTRLFASKYYGKTLDFLIQPTHQNQLVLYPPGRAYLDTVRQLTTSAAFFRTPAWLRTADLVASVTYLPLLGVFLAGMGFVATLPREDRAALWRGGAVLLLVYGLCFGSCLTVAVVHSLIQHRYTLNLFFYTALSEAAVLAWLWEVVLVQRNLRPMESTSRPASIPFRELVEEG